MKPGGIRPVKKMAKQYNENFKMESMQSEER